MTVHLL